MLGIVGNSDCPSPEDVGHKLAAIVVVAEDRPFDEHARVERDGTSVHVVLESSARAVVATRTFHAEGSCGDLASAAAVVLASWLGDAYPELSSGLSARAETLPTPPAPPPSTPSTPPPPKVTQTPFPSEVRPSTSPRRESPEVRRRLAPSAGLGAAVSSAGATPLAAFGLSWIARDPSLGAWLGLALSGVQERTLGGGIVRWSRWPVMAGPLLRISGSRMRADFSAGAVLGWLRIEGDRFSTNSKTADAVYGGFAAVKISGGPKVLEPFVGLNALLWAKRATAYVSAAPRLELDLPPTELWLVGGVAVEP